jgi:hypothetical protein
LVGSPAGLAGSNSGSDELAAERIPIGGGAAKLRGAAMRGHEVKK